MLPRKFQIQIKLLLVYVYVFCCTTTTITTRTATYALTRALDRDAHTLYYYNKPPNERGEFHFEFQTSNGITTKSAGNENGVSGVVQYVSLEGIPITWTYVADGDGYHPSGEHIPKVPLHVRTALEYIRTHPPVDEKKSRKL